MSTITDQWTGNGLADGTAVTSGNVATAGNFTGTAGTWTRAVSGTPTQETAGNGFVIVTATSTDVGRLDFAFTSGVNALRMQAVFTAAASATGVVEIMRVRNASTGIFYCRYDGSARTFGLRDNVNASDIATTPAITAGDEITIDVVLALSASPTLINGRVFARFLNNTNTSWNTDGHYFYDSLYTKALQTANFTLAWWGKTNAVGTVASPGMKWEFCGVEGITVDPADVTEQDASAYFADNPSAPYALETGSVTALVAGYRLG